MTGLLELLRPYQPPLGRPTRHMPFLVRLVLYIDYPGNDTDCWPWRGALAFGYGRIEREGRKYRAHRVVYELLVGPIPAGLQLDHLCRNRSCVNPAHLEPVTARVNTLRGFAPSALAARATHCPSGHPYDDVNTYTWEGQRHCRACRQQQGKEWRATHPHWRKR